MKQIIATWIVFFQLMPLAAASEGRRLVSIGGGVTEVVCALGFCEELVAVDTTSVFPESLEALPKLGYFRQLNTEGILRQRADLIFLTEQAGPPPVIEQLKKMGLKLQFVPDDKTLAGAKEKIRTIAKSLGVEERGEILIQAIDRDLIQAARLLDQASKGRRALFVYASGRQQIMAGGRGSSADAMFELLGLTNAAAGVEGYVNLSAEGVLRLNPDVIVLTRRGFELLGESELELPGWEKTNAGRAKRIVVVDDLLFLGFSHRLGEAAVDFAKQIKEIKWQSETH